jgi:hypothetical protein
MHATNTNEHDPSRRDVLHIDPRELRDTIRITIDRELIAQIDDRRSAISRSAYLEMLLTAALAREHPHLPENWTPERAAQQRYERLIRYLETGR